MFWINWINCFLLIFWILGCFLRFKKWVNSKGRGFFEATTFCHGFVWPHLQGRAKWPSGQGITRFHLGKSCWKGLRCFNLFHGYPFSSRRLSIFGGKPPILNQPCFINPGLTLENIHLGTFCGGLWQFLTESRMSSIARLFHLAAFYSLLELVWWLFSPRNSLSI